MKVIQALKVEGDDGKREQHRIKEGCRVAWRSGDTDGVISPPLRADIYAALWLLTQADLFDKAFLRNTRFNLRAARAAIRATCPTDPGKCKNESIMQTIDGAIHTLDAWLKILNTPADPKAEAAKHQSIEHAIHEAEHAAEVRKGK